MAEMVDMEPMTQARPSKQGWQLIQHGKLNAKRGVGREIPAARPLKCQREDRIVRSGDASSSAGGRHRQNWRWGPRCIVGRGDGRPWPGHGQPRRR
ncbi:hypothetical protein CBM2587_A160025 [Cupriavidus taiwanensis]|uniref:Uncharacterized protein n=1 Tax=Cupriavidus taiwanensis TaxID=164546 RepID=A0A975WV98_9BURK|nr:hypothetical protein CBM2587_A160025 [Cupriavidus taiwanensis]